MSKKLISELSVFFPAYNEEKNLEKTVESAVEVLEKDTDKWEIIIIDDGSTDQTNKIGKRLVKNYPDNIRLITHRPNRGYGGALKSGMYNAKFKWITFTDSDGQFDFSELDRFIIKQKETGADLVIGYYLDRKVPFYRIWGSKVWELAVFILFGLWVKDIDCGFKYFSKEVVNSIPKLEAERGPFITSEFLIKAKNAGFKIEEVGVSHYAREHGAATGANLDVILSGLSDLVKLWFKLKFKK
jgi:glycosyltransferase involved in cell wall biosynthesis